ncbi:hypothetical protein [Vibrio vulnificus]|uniref:hypothetical protein n=1 Tax=Vibrio vulnificus TaxID=672 RepID=UPI001A1C5386|nr:hypothetical protein [Vibrio vulnificus]EJV9314153.1 hypothetical protein [Vibrio vulnificus]MDS1873129.1 hypothetical protein [Vibrio vulnificus]HAS6391780.1 hypothetical protein [Vibrio vulnificus]HAS6424913.1 hypothetical protein [Vibrio vulnificus]
MIKIKKIFSLNPDYGLDKQVLFWLAVLLPIAIAVGLGIPVWIDYSLAFNAEAYDNFLKISRLPIALSSLAIPLGVLVGRLHSAKQTARQIENTQIQITNTEQDNRTKLYLSHFEHFCKHLEFIERSVCTRHSQLFPEGQYPTLDQLSMYKLIYPENGLITGVYSQGEHLEVFARNGMARLNDYYLQFSHSKSYDDFVKNIANLEGEFINTQIRCFRFTNSRSSIFLNAALQERNAGKFLFGISVELSHFFAKVEFFLELLDGIESFDSPENKTKVGRHILFQLRTPHQQKPEDRKELQDYWDQFIEKEA